MPGTVQSQPAIQMEGRGRHTGVLVTGGANMVIPITAHVSISGLGGIQVATNCMTPGSRYARGLHVRLCRGALCC